MFAHVQHHAAGVRLELFPLGRRRRWKAGLLPLAKAGVSGTGHLRSAGFPSCTHIRRPVRNLRMRGTNFPTAASAIGSAFILLVPARRSGTLFIRDYGHCFAEGSHALTPTRALEVGCSIHRCSVTTSTIATCGEEKPFPAPSPALRCDKGSLEHVRSGSLVLKDSMIVRRKVCGGAFFVWCS
jgi:hypothetical protein